MAGDYLMPASCTSGCPTKDHNSWGECVRAKGLQIGDLKHHDANKAGEKELQAYADARRQGMQPESTKFQAVRAAHQYSDANGVAYRGDTA